MNRNSIENTLLKMPKKDLQQLCNYFSQSSHGTKQNLVWNLVGGAQRLSGRRRRNRNRIVNSGRVNREAKWLLKHKETKAALEWYHENHESKTMKGIPFKDLSPAQIIDEFKLFFFRSYLHKKKEEIKGVESWSDAEKYLRVNNIEKDFYSHYNMHVTRNSSPEE